MQNATSAWTRAMKKAVRDQDGMTWFSFAGQGQTVWFSAARLRRNEEEVLDQLGTVGLQLISSTSISQFKRFVEGVSASGQRSIASRPGWVTDDIYVFGNGDVYGTQTNVIVTFQPHDHLGEAGSLKAWKQELAPFAGQPLVEFVFAAALTGLLLRFLPNLPCPIVELFGPTHSGKTALGRAALSIFGGDSESDIGAMRNWDFTLGALDEMKEAHRDGLLGLDEGNHAKLATQTGQLLRQAVFKLSSTNQRSRFGGALPKNTRTAVISTTNDSLRALLGATSSDQAVISRVTSVEVIDQWNPCPGFATTRDMIRALERIGRTNYGVAARKFVSLLIKNNVAEVAPRLFDRYEKECSRVVSDPRQANVMALIMTAAHLGKQVFPQEWNALDSVRTVMGSDVSQSPGGHLAAKKLLNFIKEAPIVKTVSVKYPLSASELVKKRCFVHIHKGRSYYLIPAPVFQKQAGHREIFEKLKQEGCVKTEGGAKPKSTIKAPRKLGEGRVYCFYRMKLRKLAAA